MPITKKLLTLSLLVVLVATSVWAVGHFLSGSNRVEAESQPSPTTTQSEPIDIGPHYQWYTPQTLQTAQAQGRTFLLFWVPWCSSCSALDTELEQRSGELPAYVTILKINMDKQKDLVTKYGISIQHTLVEIDAEGNELQKWVGGDFNTLTTHL